MTGRDRLEELFREQGIALSTLRAELKYFLSIRDANTVAVDDMSATELLKEVQYVLKISRDIT